MTTPFSAVGRGTGVVATRVDMWNVGGTYVFPTAPRQMSVVSSNANDTAAGTGIRQILIEYLDDSYNQLTTLVTLNGTTPVLTTPTNILRVNKLWATQAGSVGAAVGVIQVSFSGTIYAQIDATYTASRQSVFTVPAGRAAYIESWMVSAGSTAGDAQFAEFDFRSNSYMGTLYPGVFVTQSTVGTPGDPFIQSFDPPLYLPPQTDIKITVSRTVGAQALTVAGGFNGWLDD